jgi:hypothetical protein
MPDSTPIEYDRCSECLVQCETDLEECTTNKIAASAPEDRCDVSYRACMDACVPSASGVKS